MFGYLYKIFDSILRSMDSDVFCYETIDSLNILFYYFSFEFGFRYIHL